MSPRREKGQVALEFLTTYGWVLLIVLIGIGTLAYFGLLNPSQFLPDKCWFGPQLVCDDYSLRTSGSETNASFLFRNNFAKAIRIIAVDSLEEDKPLVSCNPLPLEIGLGKKANLTCTLGVALPQGDKNSVSLVITFRRNDSAIAPLHNVTGELFTTVI